MGQWDEVNERSKAKRLYQRAYTANGGNAVTKEDFEAEVVKDEISAIEKEIRHEVAKKKIRDSYAASALRKEAERMNAFELAEQNLYFFRTLMLECNPEEEFDPAPFHFRWSDHLINGKDNIAILGFRGCGKSEYVLRAFPLYCLAFPDKSRDFIVILKHGQESAEEVIKSIRKEYESNQLLQHNLVKINESSAKVFSAEVRDKNGEIINVRIMGFGKGASIRGLRDVNRRPRVIIGDDLQDSKDFVGEKVHETDWSWFKTDVKHLGSVNSRIFMIGNNLGEKCIMERIRTNKHLLDFSFEVVPQAGENWEPSWPQRDTRESIIKERDNELAQGSIAYGEWLREKMCEAVNDQTRIFLREDIKYFVAGTEKEIAKRCRLYLISDLASSTKQAADYRVLLLLGVDEHNNWFILECLYGQWDTSTYVDNLFSLIEDWRLDTAYFENGQIFQSIEPFIKQQMPKRGFFRIETLKPDRKKEERIALLQPRFKAGSVYMPERAHWLGEMLNELLSFTMEGCKSLHDDLLDALAYGIKIAKPANPKAIERRAVNRSARTSYSAKRLRI